MRKVFANEINKMKSPMKLISVLFVIFFVTGFISIFEYKMMFKETSFDVSKEFMLYNLTFVLMKIMLPVMLLLLTSSLFAGDYAFGTMKSILLCGIERKNYYLGKIIFILIATIFLTLTIFLSLTVVCIIMGNMSFLLTDSFIKIFLLYFIAGLGVIPIILLTALIAFFLNDFEKTITCSLVILFLSLTCDSVMGKSFYTPTGILSNSNLFFSNSFKNYSYAFVIWLVYFLVFNIINLFVFERKDIWC